MNSNLLNPNNQLPGQLPADYAQQLINNAETSNVIIGAGGAVLVVEKDNLIGAPPSQQGIEDPKIYRVLTDDPLLIRPHVSTTRDSQSALSQTMLSERLIGYAFMIFGRQMYTEDKPLSQKKPDTEEDSELALIQAAIEEYRGESSSEGAPTLPNLPQAPMSDTTSESSDTPLSNTLSQESTLFLKNMSSTDPQEIANQLLESSGMLNNPDISSSDLRMIQAQYLALAQTIAEKNKAGGGSSILNITSSGILTAVFADTLKLNDNKALSSEQKDLLVQALYNSSKKLANANLDSIVSREPPSEDYQAFTSNDSTSIETLFSSFFPNGVEGVSSQDLKMVLGSLATIMTSQSFDPDLKSMLLSHDPEVVGKALTKMIETMPSISPTLQKAIVAQIVPVLTSSISSMNGIELQKMMKSSDPQQIQTALLILSGTAHDTSMKPVEKKIVTNYLKALTDALVFLAQIRSLIVRLEGAFTQELSSAKTMTVTEQIKNAMSLYTTKLQEIMTNYTKGVNALVTQQVLSIIGPILTVGMLLLAVVVAVIALIAAIPSGGSSAVIGAGVVASIVAAAVALAVTVTVLIVTVIDIIVTAITKKGILENIFGGIKNEMLRNALIMGINVAFIVVTGILTLGVGVVTGIVVLTTKAAQITISAILKIAFEIIKETIKKLLSGVIFQQLLGLLLGAFASSGFIPDLLMKMFKAMGCDDTTATALTATFMILTALLVAIACGARGMGNAIKSIPNSVKNVAKSVSQSIEAAQTLGLQKILGNLLASFKKSLTGFLEEFFKIKQLNKLFAKLDTPDTAVAGATRGAAEEAMRNVGSWGEQILKRILEFLKDDPYVLANAIQLITTGLQITQQAIVAASSAQMAEINIQLAKLSRETAGLEAMMEFLKMTGTISAKATMASLNEASKQMFEDWKTLCTSIAKFITDASRATSQLHNKV